MKLDGALGPGYFLPGPLKEAPWGRPLLNMNWVHPGVGSTIIKHSHPISAPGPGPSLHSRVNPPGKSTLPCRRLTGHLRARGPGRVWPKVGPGDHRIPSPPRDPGESIVQKKRVRIKNETSWGWVGTQGVWEGNRENETSWDGGDDEKGNLLGGGKARK